MPSSAAILSSRSFRAALVLVVAAASSSAGADVVRTREGLVLEGKATRAADGSVSVETADGPVRIEAARVAELTTGASPRAQLRKELAAIATTDADARFRFALRAEAAGASDLAREAYASVVAAAPDHAAARRALGYEKVDVRWVPVAQARRARGLVLFGGVWMLPAEAETAAAGAPAVLAADVALADVMRSAATGDAPLARAAAVALLAVPQRQRVATAVALLADADPRVRAWAAEHLALAGDETALRPLIFSSIRDRDPDVRRAAVAAVASFGRDDVSAPYIRALSSRSTGTVANAARALGELGDVRAAGAIVKRIIGHGSSGRVVVEFLTKTAYVRDYDVEIAQASNIANPVIGHAVEGMVFDVKVIDAHTDRIVVESALIDAYNRLTGEAAKDAQGVIDAERRRAVTPPARPQ